MVIRNKMVGGQKKGSIGLLVSRVIKNKWSVVKYKGQ